MKQTNLTPCPLWAEKLAATHPDDLSAFERMALQKHIASCATCAAIRAEYEAMGKQISQLPVVEPRPGLPPGLLQLWHEDGHLASDSSDSGEEQAEGTPSAASRLISAPPARRPHRYRALFQTLAAVLVVAALLGGFLVVFASRHPGTAGHSLTPTSLGKGWNFVASPNVGSTLNGLKGVAVISASDIWAVGTSSNSPLNGNGAASINLLIEHWNGTRWSVVPTSNSRSNYNYLNGVAAVSANDVWAVGASNNDTLIEHWNGTQWSVISSPNPGSNYNYLNAVAVISANDVWAVGTSSSGSITDGFGKQTPVKRTLIEHWNGSRWSIVKSPNPSVTQNSLNGITAISANDIWAVGGLTSFTPPYTDTYQALIEHWNGSRWSVVQTPDAGSRLNSLSGVAAISPNDVWAVGVLTISAYLSGEQEQTLIEHWNGSKWSIVESANNSIADGNYLNGVVTVSANDVWAVGYSHRSYPLQGPMLIEHWNGTQWSMVSSPNPGRYYNSLTAVAAVPHSSEIWAVGYYGEGYTPERTITEVYSP